MPQPIYKRILLKLSGEALANKGAFGIDATILNRLVREIAEVVLLNVELGIVIGGGNLFRGATLSSVGIDRITGDQMGMLATIMNALAIRDALEKIEVPSLIMSALPVGALVEPFNCRKAIHHLQQKQVIIFAGGTGNPLFTTDSAASLRGIEIKADVLLKATNVDGVYSADPARDPNATRYQHLTYQQALDQQLGVMDITAFSQCRDHDLAIRVFNINKPGNLLQVVTSMTEGTLVDSGGEKNG